MAAELKLQWMLGEEGMPRPCRSQLTPTWELVSKWEYLSDKGTLEPCTENNTTWMNNEMEMCTKQP